MPYLTGEGAVFDGLACVRHFMVAWSADPGEGYCSRSEAGPFGARGNEDWLVQANGYGSAPANTHFPGDTLTFKGADRNGSGAEGPAIMEHLRVHWDVEQGDLLWWELIGYGTGELLRKAAAALNISDTGSPAPVNARGMGVTLGATDFSIRRAVMDIMCLNAVHNDSDTNGFTGRSRGNFKGGFEIDLYYDDRDDLPDEHGYTALSIDCENATSWDMSYVYIDSVKFKKDVEGERDGRAKENSAIVKGRWWGWNGTIQGTLTAPDSTIIWPVP